MVKNKVWWIVPVLAALAGYWFVDHSAQRPGGGLHTLARGALADLTVPVAVVHVPHVIVINPAGQSVALPAAVAGRVTVLNLWATWCAPCIEELPSLAALAAAYPDSIQVIALNIDASADETKAFLDQHAPTLAAWRDPKMATVQALKAQGVPATILYDSTGLERARLMGKADWNGPDARRLIDTLLLQEKSMSSSVKGRM
jgi:thiol-disulfide isomerase/thioredoxin